MGKNVFKRLAIGKIAICIENRNQEKDFIKTCRQFGEPLLRKDATVYEDVNGKKKPIFPIYYGFTETGCIRVNWYTVNKSTVIDNGYMIMDYKSFKGNIE